MSGALVSLVAKGAQDVYITNNDSANSFFKMKYSRHTNFAQAVKPLEIQGDIVNFGISTIQIRSLGDLVNGLWLTGGSSWEYQTGYNGNFINPPIVTLVPPLGTLIPPPGILGYLTGTIFELYIGGQIIDTQTIDFMTDVWPIYMAENYTKSAMFNNYTGCGGPTGNGPVDYTFVPLHFFFCDNKMFLPLIALQYHQIEIRIRWGPYISQMVIDGGSPVQVNSNFIYLDTAEREEMVNKSMDLLITQVQTSSTSSFSNLHSLNVDLSVLNHPVKSIYFGFAAIGNPTVSAAWTFDTGTITLNGTYLLENQNPSYFHTVQGYYGTPNGMISLNSSISNSPSFTQYFTYNFCLDACSYKPTGTCNFSRMDNAVLSLSKVYEMHASGINFFTTPFTTYAINYNVLRIKEGLAGILFSN